jgi:hypothetical protein
MAYAEVDCVHMVYCLEQGNNISDPEHVGCSLTTLTKIRFSRKFCGSRNCSNTVFNAEPNILRG